MAREERDRALEEADRCRRLLVGEDLDVGEPGEIVDRNVNAFPASHPAPDTSRVGQPRIAMRGRPSDDPFPRPALDAAKLLDVDVDELAGSRTLVAVDRLRRIEPRAFP